MNKIKFILIIAAFVFGVIAGICYAIYAGSWPIGTVVFIFGWIFYPSVKEAFVNLLSN